MARNESFVKKILALNLLVLQLVRILMHPLNINGAHLSCFKPRVGPDTDVSCVFLHGTSPAITGASDGSSHEIDEKELRAYETRGSKRGTGACDIEFRY